MKTISAGQKLYYPWQDNTSLTKNSFFLCNPATDYASKRVDCRFVILQEEETFLYQPFFASEDELAPLVPLNWHRLQILVNTLQPCQGGADPVTCGKWDYLAKALEMYGYPGTGPFVAAACQFFLASDPSADRICQTLIPYLVKQTGRVVLTEPFLQSAAQVKR